VTLAHALAVGGILSIGPTPVDDALGLPLLGLAVVEDVVVSAATARFGCAAAPVESVFPVGVALVLLTVAYLTAGREPADGVPAGGDQSTDDQAQRLHDGRPSDEARQQCPVPGTASMVTDT